MSAQPAPTQLPAIQKCPMQPQMVQPGPLMLPPPILAQLTTHGQPQVWPAWQVGPGVPEDTVTVLGNPDGGGGGGGQDESVGGVGYGPGLNVQTTGEPELRVWVWVMVTGGGMILMASQRIAAASVDEDDAEWP